MRTNIELDDELMQAAQAVTGATKKATVEQGLRLLLRKHRQQKAIAELAGIGWEGNLEAMRQARDGDRRP
jgi:Arc/MetJ family transcription regulator